MKRLALLVGLVSALWAPALAHDGQHGCFDHWNINNIQTYLQQRIRLGAANGSLTPSECAALQNRYNRIAELERCLRKGGLSYAERARLDNELDALSAAIYRESHDGNFLGLHPWSWINTATYRPAGWDQARWARVKWDRRPGDWDGDKSFDDRNINSKQQNLSRRIKHGYKDGSLDAHELDKLQDNYSKIARQEALLRSTGGGLSYEERRKLDKKMDRLNKKVYKDRHD
ncbi:MAG TPA: hypothetical protein V6D17_15760 [Candidatus Obscuribacterales bacterium]